MQREQLGMEGTARHRAMFWKRTGGSGRTSSLWVDIREDGVYTIPTFRPADTAAVIITLKNIATPCNTRR